MLSPVSTSRENFSREGQVAFLRRVTEDDSFRSALEADPRATLAMYGLHVDSEQIPSKVRLPNQNGILDALIEVEDEDEDRIRDTIWWGFAGS